jgi:hypothetical protein
MQEASQHSKTRILIDMSIPKVPPRDLQLKPTSISQTLFHSPVKKKKLDRATPIALGKGAQKKRTKSVASMTQNSNLRVLNELRTDLANTYDPETRKKTHKKTSSGIRVSHSRELESGFEWLSVPKPQSSHHKLLIQNRKKSRPSDAASKRSLKIDQSHPQDTSGSSHKYSLPRSFLVVAKSNLTSGNSQPQQAHIDHQSSVSKLDFDRPHLQPEPDFEKSHLIIRDAQVCLAHLASTQVRSRTQLRRSHGIIRAVQTVRV